MMYVRVNYVSGSGGNPSYPLIAEENNLGHSDPKLEKDYTRIHVNSLGLIRFYQQCNCLSAVENLTADILNRVERRHTVDIDNRALSSCHVADQSFLLNLTPSSSNTRDL